MKIAVFTSNQPRHLNLIRRLAEVADEVVAIQECATLFTGKVADTVYQRSEKMEAYFAHMLAAEKEAFGDIALLPANVRVVALKMGDVQHLTPERLAFALDADCVIVFGASYIKPPLVDALIAKKAVNIHMGVSPYYRGAACNFWALYDGRPELVGATIHRLSRGLDSGDMLFHALPKPGEYEPFMLGMKAVDAAHRALAQHARDGTLLTMPVVKQDKSQQLRYSRYTDFDDAVVEQYLSHLPTADAIGATLKARQGAYALLEPVYY